MVLFYLCSYLVHGHSTAASVIGLLVRLTEIGPRGSVVWDRAQANRGGLTPLPAETERRRYERLCRRSENAVGAHFFQQDMSWWQWRAVC